MVPEKILIADMIFMYREAAFGGFSYYYIVLKQKIS